MNLESPISNLPPDFIFRVRNDLVQYSLHCDKHPFRRSNRLNHGCSRTVSEQRLTDDVLGVGIESQVEGAEFDAYQ